MDESGKMCVCRGCMGADIKADKQRLHMAQEKKKQRGNHVFSPKPTGRVTVHVQSNPLG